MIHKERHTNDLRLQESQQELANLRVSGDWLTKILAN